MYNFFVDEVIRVKNEKIFSFNNIKKDIIVTQAVEEHYRNSNICLFCGKDIIFSEVSDHCQIIGEYRCPALKECNKNVEQKKGNFIPVAFRNFTIYYCHLYFRN